MKNAIATLFVLSLGLASGAVSASSFGGIAYGAGATAAPVVVNGMKLPVEAKPKTSSANLYRGEHSVAAEHSGQKVWSRYSLRPFNFALN